MNEDGWVTVNLDEEAANARKKENKSVFTQELKRELLNDLRYYASATTTTTATGTWTVG